jgi:hypothetical protein
MVYQGMLPDKIPIIIAAHPCTTPADKKVPTIPILSAITPHSHPFAEKPKKKKKIIEREREREREGQSRFWLRPKLFFHKIIVGGFLTNPQTDRRTIQEGKQAEEEEEQEDEECQWVFGTCCTSSRGDADKACDHALHCTNDRRLAKEDNIKNSPHKETHSCAHVGVDDSN